MHEFTLSLKDYSKSNTLDTQSSEKEKDEENEQLDDVTNLNTITDLIRKGKEGAGNKSLSRKELSALETLQMNYSIV